MRVLFLTHVFPFPLDAGPKVRAYYTLRHIAARHTVTLVSFVRDSDGPEAVAHLQTFCERVVTVPMRRSRLRDGLALGRSLIRGEPFLIVRDRAESLIVALRELTAGRPGGGFDIIHADQLWMAPYALAAWAEAARRRDVPRLVLDQHNAVHLVPRRLAEAAQNPLLRYWLRLEAGRMARYEACVCRQFDRVVTVTAEDGEALLSLYPNGSRPAPFPVIPICVDPEAVAPRTRPGGASGILFVGGMHWPPNADGVLWFVREVLPRVQSRWPEAHFFAVGRNSPLELQSATAPRAGTVIAPGYVADTQEYWESSRLFVVPLRAGGGMRVKILDAWARGLPVIATTIGAEGIAYRDGENILIADTPDAFAEVVIRVLADDKLAARLAAGGRAAVENYYDWRKAYQAWDDIYTPVASHYPSESESLKR